MNRGGGTTWAILDTRSSGAYEPERNRQLSLERAQQVAAALGFYGVATNRLVPRGFGPDQPVADNDTEIGRQQNRRVELVRIESRPSN